MSYARESLGTTSTPVQDEVRLLYSNGQAFYNQGRFDSALNAFQQAFRVSPLSMIMFAIGQTLYAMGAHAGDATSAAQRWSEAVAQYRAYVQADPNGERAAEAHEQIASLTAALTPKDPGANDVMPPPATSVPSLVTAGGPRISVVVIAVGVGLLAIAGLAIWRSRAVRKNRRRVRRNSRPWTHDSDYAAALRDLERSRAKLRQRL